MTKVYTTHELQQLISAIKKSNKTIGFVPTMGALHQGHLSLVDQCVNQNDICIVSIFVNPTQFNDKNDLDKYPRTLEQDCDLLQKHGVNIVFAPSENEIYPEPDKRVFNFGQLDKVMEGKHRPGHFNGVAQVVSRLFDLVNPTNAYFGEKDFQQIAIIRNMVKQLDLPVKIISMPIIREDSGLAMSSRNERLTADQRKNASHIAEALTKSSKFAPQKSVKEMTETVIDEINNIDHLKTEYFEIVDGYTLKTIADWNETNYAVGCIAVFCGDIRLIDNITYYSDK